MATPFLSARWTNLFNLTYRVDPELLSPHVPDGVELDIHQGSAFVSLVAFDFLDTRVFGIPWPGYRDFPELNLRYYLKYKNQRGVAFLQEYVPKRIIAKMARAIYNEPYDYAPIRSETKADDTSHDYTLALDVGGRTHTIRVSATPSPHTPPRDSLAHYFKEHKWGFGHDHKGRTLTYRVEHAIWDVYDVQSYSLDVDFGLLYGEQWAFLADEEPFCAVFALGSPVKVFPKGGLENIGDEPMDHTLPVELQD
ncbi:unnamed protein product [Laminaria digitata]